jgi:hypothetical protein
MTGTTKARPSLVRDERSGVWLPRGKTEEDIAERRVLRLAGRKVVTEVEFKDGTAVRDTGEEGVYSGGVFVPTN